MTAVLDKGFVELVDHMGSDLTVVNAARVSFGKRKRVMSIPDERLIHFLAKHKHMSPFRHVVFQLHCKVPEFIARQWYKHTIGMEYTENSPLKDQAWNEISGRYVDLSQVEYYIPSVFRAQSEDNKQASAGEIREQSYANAVYEQALKDSSWAYKELIRIGVAKEQARAVIPLCFYTEFYWTTSLQAIHNFIELRSHAGAQWEITEYSRVIQSLITPFVPVSMEALSGRHPSKDSPIQEPRSMAGG